MFDKCVTWLIRSFNIKNVLNIVKKYFYNLHTKNVKMYTLLDTF